ncbi:transforming growth factor-beta receptor type 3-like protein isoform X9 [Cavia porcellus]|uniref:transforming growth factor-beta receptor type 3-like protein isoform X9 n=1 Tax=Cavia porcellus TaxID=10141 RepID=UPI002FE3DE2F
MRPPSAAGLAATSGGRSRSLVATQWGRICHRLCVPISRGAGRDKEAGHFPGGPREARPLSSEPSSTHPASTPFPRDAWALAAQTPFPSGAVGCGGRLPAPWGPTRGARGQPRVRAGGSGAALPGLGPGAAPLLGDAVLASSTRARPGAAARRLPRRRLGHLPAAAAAAAAAKPGQRPPRALQLPPAPGLQCVGAVPALPAEPLPPPPGSRPEARAPHPAATASVSVFASGRGLRGKRREPRHQRPPPAHADAAHRGHRAAAAPRYAGSATAQDALGPGWASGSGLQTQHCSSRHRATQEPPGKGSARPDARACARARSPGARTGSGTGAGGLRAGSRAGRRAQPRVRALSVPAPWTAGQGLAQQPPASEAPVRQQGHPQPGLQDQACQDRALCHAWDAWDAMLQQQDLCLPFHHLIWAQNKPLDCSC